ncbi:expressed unknown protein [Seminavis robusta]|uniref:Uncharacterized protein n=1 Tax=Seminavis robusta TaxID=568900 RepID=A0A9N8DZH3_9STRA|nr:expressed unknown protein [Seminavis robusta]|eukprot:Sro390_g132860.1 n/a (428) ;mRNA; f:39479-40762
MGYHNSHQEIRVLSVEDAIETLTKLEHRLKEGTSVKQRKRVKGVQSLSLTLALADTSVPQDEQLVTLCQGVARCFPKLKSLQLSSEIEHEEHPESHGHTFCIPVQALTALLHPNKGLKKLNELTLDGLYFHANDESIRILVKAISRHDGIKKCYLYDTKMTNLSSGRSAMEKFVSAIAKKVEKLVIIGCRLAALEEAEAGVWDGSCLVKLCRSTTLQEVKLHNIRELQEEHMVLMSQALTTNTSIRKLSILKTQELADLPPEESLHASNHRQLDKKKKKKSSRRSNRQTLSSDAGTLAMANMLRENTTLEEICLSAVDFNEYSAMFLGNALEQDNTTLRELWLMIPAHNGGTSSFPVDDRRIEHYLRLNRAGRYRVMQQAADAGGSMIPTGDERKFWINTLLVSKRDIDCSFFLLRNMPSLCDGTIR